MCLKIEFILSRCNNVNAKDFYRYGGRGIKCNFKNIYELWFELQKSDKLNLLLDFPELYEIDRINNNGHYEIGNIKISTKSGVTKSTSIYYAHAHGVSTVLSDLII